MTDEQMRIAIAEACGLKVIDVPFIPNQTKAAGCVFTDAARTEWRRCYPNSCGVYGIPDYLNDLNAMHEAERMLPVAQWDRYTQWLGELARGTRRFVVCHATARQRAEAFLKTKGIIP